MRQPLALGLLALLAADAASAQCTFDIRTGDAMQYDVTSIEVRASCEQVTVNLEHTGELPAAAMGHNWVLSKPADMKSIAQAGMSAGLDNDYLPPGDDRVLAATPIIGGGKSTSVTFSLEKLDETEYVFFCSFPGHWTVMKGTFRVVRES